MVVIVASTVLVFLCAVGVWLRHVRVTRRRRRDAARPNVSWATETTALRLRLNGTLNKRDYRQIVEGIAARDAVDRPIDVPQV